jgi:hypothetical protein
VRSRFSLDLTYFFHSLIQRRTLDEIRAFRNPKDLSEKARKGRKLKIFKGILDDVATLTEEELHAELFYIIDYPIRKVLFKPFGLCENHFERYSKQTIIPDCVYDASADWKQRKKVVKELLRGTRRLLRSVRYSKDGNLIKRMTNEIIGYEFIIKNFQVDSDGPIHSQFFSLNAWLLRLFNKGERALSEEEMYLIKKKLLPLYRVYAVHIFKNQRSDPASFPLQMLAIGSIWSFNRYITKKTIIEFFKLSEKDLLSRVIEGLQESKLWVMLGDEEKIFLEEDPTKTVIRGDLHHWLNRENASNSLREYAVKIYLFLCNELESRNVNVQAIIHSHVRSKLLSHSELQGF